MLKFSPDDSVIDEDENHNSSSSCTNVISNEETELFRSDSYRKINSIKIHNSSDVIIGPVTHYNINGKLTILKRETFNKLKKNEAILDQTKFDNDKLSNVEKSTTQKQQCIFCQKILLISLLILLGIMTIAIFLKISIPRNNHGKCQFPKHSFQFESDLNIADWHLNDSKYFNISSTSVSLILVKYEYIDENVQIYCQRVSNYDQVENHDFNCTFFINENGNIYMHIKKKGYKNNEKLLLKEPVFYQIVHTMTAFNNINVVWVSLFVTISILIIIIVLKFFIIESCLKIDSKKKIDSNFTCIKKETIHKENEVICTKKIENHTIFSKKDWSGYQSKYCERFTSPVKLIVIKHIGAGKIADTFEMCSRRLITVQSENMARGMPDIYCNFFIGGDGNIYVGRGWDAQPEFKKDTIDIVFSGNFDIDEPPEIMLAATRALIREGLNSNKLAVDYVIVPHNQTVSTRSPGIHLIENIKNWPHYSEGLFFHDI